MDRLIRALWNVRFRGKVRLLSRLVPRTGIRSAHVFGTRLELDLADYVQRMMYLGCFEREETATVIRHLRPGMTFVDVGANAGYFTYLAAARVGITGRVCSIEPDPVLFKKLAGAVAENDLKCVAVRNVALGREPGELPLFVPPTAHANRAPTMTPVPGWEEVRVIVCTLDYMLDDSGIATVDLLKIDVEGYEAEVLAGAMRAFGEGRVRAVLCEFNDYWLRQQGTTPAALWQTFVAKGFRAAHPMPDFPAGSTVNAFFTRV